MRNNKVTIFNNLVLTTCFVLISASNVISESCKKEVTNFINNPTKINYKVLLHVQETNSTNLCWSEIENNSIVLSKLYNRVKNGNRWAISILVNHLNKLDGGELEDAFIALGESFDSNPIVLLELLNNNYIDEHHFKQSLVALPLTYVDDKKRTLTALKQRKNKIKSVKKIGLASPKKTSVNVLDDKITHIYKIWP